MQWRSNSSVPKYAPPDDGTPGVMRRVETDQVATGGGIVIALVNNMPDAAMASAEAQFCQLLNAAAGASSLRINLYRIPSISQAGQDLPIRRDRYFDIADLWNHRVDGVVVTGTGPHAANLQNESFWQDLVRVFDWAEDNGVSTIASCLAAHAAVLYFDEIERKRLPQKKFGVFEHVKVGCHPLLEAVPDQFLVPHSRWNEVDVSELQSRGYRVLTASPGAGVDLFVKQRKSLLLCFQGHLEYEQSILVREYRRDIRRFLTGVRETYPEMPVNVFSDETTNLFEQFQAYALCHSRLDLLDAVPMPAALVDFGGGWNNVAVRIYRNWLRYVGAQSLANASIRSRREPKHG